MSIGPPKVLHPRPELYNNNYPYSFRCGTGSLNRTGSFEHSSTRYSTSGWPETPPTSSGIRCATISERFPGPRKLTFPGLNCHDGLSVYQ